MYFYIENVQHNGNCRLFWRDGGQGYTTNLKDAWLVKEEKAKSLCAGRPDQDFPRPAAEMIAKLQHHVPR